MFNIIRMDLYRLFHSKAIKIGILAAVIISFMGMLINWGIVSIVNWTTGGDVSALIGMSMFIPAIAWVEGADFASIVLTGTGALSLFISCMIASSFIGAEQSCGYVKNIAGQISNKGNTILSKFVVTCLIQFIILAVYAIVCSICTPIFFNQFITSYSIGELFAALGLRFLLFCAIDAILLFFCTLTKSHAVSMVVGAIFGVGVTNIAYFMINMLLGIAKINVNVSEIMPDGINGTLAIGSLDTIAVKAIVVSIIFIIAFVGIAVAIFKKRDVR